MSRTSSSSRLILVLLRLLPLLLAGQVTAATERREVVSCRQEVHPGPVRELWKLTRTLLETLPKEDKPRIRKRILPKFCTRCSEKAIGWAELRDMMDIYQKKVFSKVKVKALLHPHFPILFHRLQDSLHTCVPKSRPSKWKRDIKKLQKKIERRPDGALKAASEFLVLLGWTGELLHQRVF